MLLHHKAFTQPYFFFLASHPCICCPWCSACRGFPARSSLYPVHVFEILPVKLSPVTTHNQLFNYFWGFFQNVLQELQISQMSSYSSKKLQTLLSGSAVFRFTESKQYTLFACFYDKNSW